MRKRQSKYKSNLFKGENVKDYSSSSIENMNKLNLRTGEEFNSEEKSPFKQSKLRVRRRDKSSVRSKIGTLIYTAKKNPNNPLSKGKKKIKLFNFD